jgi:calcineurin-like phosphoesterase family protein
MGVFFISDTHLGHANIIKYCQRPFLSAAERQMLADGIQFKPCTETVRCHDDAIIDNINAAVGEKDQLWILGDFCWGDRSKARPYRDRIKCQDVRLIWGNHDHPSVGDAFRATYQYHMIEIGEQRVIMCHYPMRSWEHSHRGSWQLFGHVHGNLDDIPHLLTLDVGVDTHNFKPWSWEEICEYMVPRQGAWNVYRQRWVDKEQGGMKPGTHG